jgi:outer membrane lipoprotein-sorting protein
VRFVGCLLTFAALLIPAAPARRDAMDANAMLRRVDECRNPLQYYTVDVELTTNHRGEIRMWEFRVYGNGADTSLLEFRTPAADKGKYYLMLRDDMWIYLPNTSRPLRISPLQRLAGEASNGDVARTSYSVDYDAELAGEESVDGRAAYVLELKGRDTDMSYGRVRLWVARESGEPIQAEFYALSGRLLKRAFFREFGMLAGKRAVTKIEIQDAVRPDHSTIMKYSNLVSKRYPEKMFNRNYLGKW